MAPTNRPMMPEVMKPPMAPMKMMSMGTWAPLPNSIGFKKVSQPPAKILQIVKTTAAKVLVVENTYYLMRLQITTLRKQLGVHLLHQQRVEQHRVFGLMSVE